MHSHAERGNEVMLSLVLERMRAVQTTGLEPRVMCLGPARF